MALKKSYLYIISCFVIVIASLLSLQLYMRLTPITANHGGIVYELQAGTSKKLFLSQLKERKLIPHWFLFATYVYLHPNAQLKTGEYFFAEKASLYDLWRNITLGSGRYYHSFTIVPGWSYKQLKSAITHLPGLKPVLTGLNDARMMQTLGQADQHPEGFFFPDTYFYTKGDTDKVILQKAYILMQQHLQSAWENRNMNLPYETPYQALIAASLVEKEAHLNDEFARIAGVLVNRLQKGMLLQFDPTVIYALGDHYDGKINKSDLQFNAEHNTYLHKGLPPTPIAMPSLKAIQAVLHPESHDYYYFVARGDGSHIFSKTLAEHNHAVNHVTNSTLKPNVSASKNTKPYINTSGFKPYLLN